MTKERAQFQWDGKNVNQRHFIKTEIDHLARVWCKPRWRWAPPYWDRWGGRRPPRCRTGPLNLYCTHRPGWSRCWCCSSADGLGPTQQSAGSRSPASVAGSHHAWRRRWLSCLSKRERERKRVNLKIHFQRRTCENPRLQSHSDQNQWWVRVN